MKDVLGRRYLNQGCLSGSPWKPRHAEAEARPRELRPSHGVAFCPPLAPCILSVSQTLFLGLPGPHLSKLFPSSEGILLSWSPGWLCLAWFVAWADRIRRQMRLGRSLISVFPLVIIMMKSRTGRGWWNTGKGGTVIVRARQRAAESPWVMADRWRVQGQDQNSAEFRKCTTHYGILLHWLGETPIYLDLLLVWSPWKGLLTTKPCAEEIEAWRPDSCLRSVWGWLFSFIAPKHLQRRKNVFICHICKSVTPTYVLGSGWRLDIWKMIFGWKEYFLVWFSSLLCKMVLIWRNS